VRKISFTGSTAVGKHLARHSADTLKKLSLELGGNAPFIVFDDADVDAAIDGVMAAKFRNGGQTCVSPNRIYVQEKVYENFVAKLGARVAALKVGPATDPASQIGPMINARAIAKIDQHVRDAIGRGARVITGGKRLQGPGFESDNYYAPTVLANVTGEMQCSCEETFGPVAPTPLRDGRGSDCRCQCHALWPGCVFLFDRCAPHPSRHRCAGKRYRGRQ
jgi:succinate-semialdehyde dehydrogenase/glutarate-semialdehyde dehydrogenase